VTLPSALGGTALLAWRLTATSRAKTWDDGEGAYLYGGRWNSKGVRTVYCSLDAATATLEVAVHIGFPALDTVPHTMTTFEILKAADVHVVQVADVPNPNWLIPSTPSGGQQAFGDALLKAHKFVAIPSAVSHDSWNLIFTPAQAAGAYKLTSQQPYALDPRLHPPSK
jgi:RES domain-containing protein